MKVAMEGCSITNGITAALLAFSTCVSTPALAAFADQFAVGQPVTVEVFTTVPHRSNGATAKLNALTHSGDRIFAVESYDGLIYEITDGVTRVWFDVAAALGSDFNNSDNVEGGLRSVAFHPEFQRNGKLYTSQDQDRLQNPSNGVYLSDVDAPQPTDSVVTEWTLTSDGELTASRELLRIGQPGLHSIKQIAFNNYASVGSDDYGLLYIAHGDGGSVENGFASHRNSALGKIIRIDPQATQQSAYTIPVNNPFIGDPNIPDEVYAPGFRNPHNLSFSRSGILFVADIGSGNVEEINLVTSGEDYGWGAREGRFTYLNTTRGSGVTALPANDVDFGFTYPAASFRHDVNHDGGLAIAGGYAVENGSDVDGLYFFGEFGSTGELLYSSVSQMQAAVTKGFVSSLSEATVFRSNILFDHDGNTSTPALLRTSLLDLFNDSPQYNVASARADQRFGRGPDGELYITSKQNNTIYLVTSSVRQISTPDSVCFDSDGDGWGWNGTSSCIVTPTETAPEDNQSEPDAGACVDTDGDGWGWNGVSSCRLSSEPVDSVSGDEPGEENFPATICIDSDGDGWGWNGIESCIVDTVPTAPTAPTAPDEIPMACIDTDGDGWGWNGVESCLIVR